MKKWKVLSLLTLVMAVPLGITACSSSEFWKTPEVQTEQTVDNSENDATVRGRHRRQTVGISEYRSRRCNQ